MQTATICIHFSFGSGSKNQSIGPVSDPSRVRNQPADQSSQNLSLPQVGRSIVHRRSPRVGEVGDVGTTPLDHRDLRWSLRWRFRKVWMALPGVARLENWEVPCVGDGHHVVSLVNWWYGRFRHCAKPKELRISCLQRLGPHDALCYGEWLHQRGMADASRTDMFTAEGRVTESEVRLHGRSWPKNARQIQFVSLSSVTSGRRTL